MLRIIPHPPQIELLVWHIRSMSRDYLWCTSRFLYTNLKLVNYVSKFSRESLSGISDQRALLCPPSHQIEIVSIQSFWHGFIMVVHERNRFLRVWEKWGTPMAKIILWKNISWWGDLTYVETFGQYIRMTMIPVEYVVISPLKKWPFSN